MTAAGPAVSSLVDLIHTNGSRAITEKVVRLAISIGEAEGLRRALVDRYAGDPFVKARPTGQMEP